VLSVSACAGVSPLSDDPFDSSEPGLTLVPVNHTDRYALNVFADKYWAADVPPEGGGGSRTCCYPGLKDWSKPVTVRWTWGTESDPKTKFILRAPEKHSVVVHFPAGGPSRNDDMSKDEAYLCVILRDTDRAELAFSTSGRGCFNK
jgi:hypothetical protein